MKIQASLIDGNTVQVQLYDEDDVRATEFSDERLPQSWAAIDFDETEARDLLEWLDRRRDGDWQGRRRTIHASSEHLLIDGREAGFTVRLSSQNEVDTFRNQISSVLSLIIGHSDDP